MLDQASGACAARIRYHRQVVADRGRCEARGKGLLCAQGIEVRGR